VSDQLCALVRDGVIAPPKRADKKVRLRDATPPEAPVPDVFYNFYAPAVPAGSYPGSGAQLYVSPRPVPPRVGHTWYTYPPFMPHEFLYKHRRHYIRPAGATGMRTDVHAYWW
jgi:hypothetical protein